MIAVNYIDHMGSDLSVVNAARVSFGKKSDWLPRVHNGEEKVLNKKEISFKLSPFDNSIFEFIKDNN